MQKTIASQFRRATLLTFAAGLGALSGCGDAGFFSRNQMDGEAMGNLGADLDAKNVTVVPYSTRCGVNTAAPCAKHIDPAVEIYIDGHSLIFDFSNVVEPGTFPDDDFEGYMLEVAPHADSPILAAVVDPGATTLDLDMSNLAHDRGHLEVNFAGVAYGPGDFLKIDLLVGPIQLLHRDAE
jgi:hypothetical protein